jgi:N-acetylglucosamine-6-sulfatase
VLPLPARRRALALALALACLGGAAACGDTGARGSGDSGQSQPTITAGPDQVRAAQAGPPRERPNLLVIETDDMRWDDLRFMPSVRRLIQARGLTFENSFAPYPLCCPSRSSFMSGQYTHNHHVYTHLEPYGFAAFHDQHTIATVLQGVGYRTALVGKYLNGYGEQYLRSGKPSLHYIPPGWDQWYAGSDHQWDYDDPNYGGGTYSYDHLVQNINGVVHAFPGRYSTDVLAEQAREVMDGFGRSRAPWFVWWTPTAPHHGLPVEPDDPQPTRRGDGDFDEWDTPGRPNWVKGRFDKVVTHGSGTPLHHPAEADVKDKPIYLRKLPPLTAVEKAAETEITRQRAESLYALDVQIRRTIAHLRQTGQLAHTVIAFTSDNGYYLGEHRKRTGKVNLHEPSLRVPFLIAGPGVPHGRRYDPITTVDMASTLAAYAGTTMSGADGTSLLPVIRDGDQGWTRAVVTEAMMGFGRYAEHFKLGRTPLDTRGLRLGRWKLTRYSTGEAELYDLWKDPLELRNLAHKPAYTKTLQQMENLYSQYSDCAGAGCRVPIPKAFRLTTAQDREITDHEVATTNAYYDN